MHPVHQYQRQKGHQGKEDNTEAPYPKRNILYERLFHVADLVWILVKIELTIVNKS